MENKTICQLVEQLSNESFNGKQKELMAEIRGLHPTMQQIFAGFALSWIKDYAENYRADGRNKYSIEECRKLMTAFKTMFPDEELRTKFPCI